MLSSCRVLDNIRRIFLKGVQSVQPVSLFGEDECVRKVILIKKEGKMPVLGEDVSGKNFHLIGFGKAVLGMAVQMEQILGNRLKSGILSVPVGTGDTFATVEEMHLLPGTKIEVFEGALNNLPDEAAMQTAVRIKRLAESMKQDDILFVLISGGGSALLPLPVPHITLEEKVQIIRTLAAKGASIEELNIVRISISQIKGGKLAQAASGAYKIISLVLSDIVDDPLQLIASGPTVSFQNKGDSAEVILKRYGIWDSLREEVKSVIKVQPSAKVPLKNSCVHIIGNNKIAANSCHREASELGYNSFVISTSIVGNVSDVSSRYVSFLELLQKFLRNEISEGTFKDQWPFQDCTTRDKFLDFLKARDKGKGLCLIFAGETTVEVIGNGIGGRNQELALRMSVALHESRSLADIYFLSAGTDGIDGPTSAAGAIGGREVVSEFLKNGSVEDIGQFLDKNDSYNFYRNLLNGRYHIVTGHTGTNVMDLHLIIIPT